MNREDIPEGNTSKRQSFYEFRFRELDALEGSTKDLLKLIEDHFSTFAIAQEATAGQIREFDKLWARFSTYADNVYQYSGPQLSTVIKMIDHCVGNALRLNLGQDILYPTDDGRRFYIAGLEFTGMCEASEIIELIDEERGVLDREMVFMM